MTRPASGLASGIVFDDGGGSAATIAFGVLKFARSRMLNIPGAKLKVQSLADPDRFPCGKIPRGEPRPGQQIARIAIESAVVRLGKERLGIRLFGGTSAALTIAPD